MCSVLEGDDVIALAMPAGEPGRTFDRQIIRFRRARCKHDLPRLGAEELGNLATRFLYRLGSLYPRMHAAQNGHYRSVR